MEKQIVLIPVDEHDKDLAGAYNSINGTSGCYVKEQEGYFFTPEQMEQFIKDSRNSLIHSVTKYIQSLNIK